MPIEWIPLVAKAAVGAATSTALREAYGGAKGKVSGLLSDALSKGPLAESLEAAYREGFTGFRGSLAGAFPIDDEEIERGLQALASHEEFTATVGELPYAPFKTIDTTRARELFLNLLGSEGMEGRDFEAAWRAFGLRFERAAAKDQSLKNLFDLTRAARQEKREEKQLQTLEEIKELLQSLAEFASRIPDPEPALQKHRKSLYQRFRYADTRGLFLREKEGVGEGIELRQVFVETPLARIVEKKEKDREGKEREGKKARLPEESDREEVRKFGEILARERLFVVLGPPGSGKSTLLRCLCLTLCRPDGVEPLLEHSLPPEVIPVLLQLKEFASALRETSNLELDRFLLERLKGQITGLEDHLNSGRAMVLLDGLDEVFDESHRRWVSDEVWRLVSRFPQARFVLTSRPHGYQAAPLPGPVPRWELQRFGDQEIGRFFKSWFEALAREGGEIGAEESPQKRAEALTTEILARPNLKEMAQNPLLCTLIVLVHRSRSGLLPERRVEFFKAAVHTLVERWEQSKRSPKQEGKNWEIPEPNVLFRALAEVAWRALHELKAREIPQDKLVAWIAEYLDREPAWGGLRAVSGARDLLRLIQERLGLLIDLGGGYCQFAHLSLHEYLASVFIRDRLSEAEVLKVVRFYLHDPMWDEVLILLCTDSAQALFSRLVLSLLQRPTGDFEEFIYRDLRFLCHCLRDGASVAPPVRAQLVRKAIEALTNRLTPDVPDLIEDLIGLGPSRELAATIRGVMLEGEEDEVEASYRYFSKVFIDDAENREAFTAILLNPDYWGNEYTALDYFGNVGGLSREVVAAVIEMLAYSHPDFRGRAVDSIVRHNLVSELDADLRASLVSGSGACLGAIECFVVMPEVDHKISDSILLLVGGDTPEIRTAALYFLSVHPIRDGEGRIAPHLVARVVERLSDSDVEVRKAAIDLFYSLRLFEQDIVEAIGPALEDKDSGVRSRAAKFLLEAAPLGSLWNSAAKDCSKGLGANYDSRIIIGMMSSADEDQRSSAVDLLVRRCDEPGTVDFLLGCLGDLSLQARSRALSALVDVSPSDLAVQKAVVESLFDPDHEFASRAVYAFKRLVSVSVEVCVALVERISSIQDPEHGVVRMLARWSGDSGVVRNLFWKGMEARDRGGLARGFVFFSEIGEGSQEIVQIAFEALDNESECVRSEAISYLERFRVADPQVKSRIAARLDDPDELVSCAALYYFIQIGIDGEVVDKVLQQASRHIPGWGHPEFSEAIGRFAGRHKEFRSRFLNEVLRRYFVDSVVALKAAANELDTIRRKKRPLKLYF